MRSSGYRRDGADLAPQRCGQAYYRVVPEALLALSDTLRAPAG
jgi:hypothetical protein